MVAGGRVSAPCRVSDAWVLRGAWAPCEGSGGDADHCSVNGLVQRTVLNVHTIHFPMFYCSISMSAVISRGDLF